MPLKVTNGEPTLEASGSTFTMSIGDTVKCVITESGGAQTLKVYVAGTERLSSTKIDDTWSGGGVTWNKITLGYDANGNLTDDGLYLFTYDAWNWLVKATRWRAGDRVESGMVDRHTRPAERAAPGAASTARKR